MAKDDYWEYLDEKEGKWKVRDDAPDWAKKEVEEFYKKIYPEPNENGIIERY